MDFIFDKIETINCAHCGELVDVADQPAFNVLPCPHCNGDVRIPGKLGNLLLEEEVGRGAAGIVYKALDATLHRHVAVKILKPDGGEDNRKIVEATVAEARALAAINHPNVVHIHTIGLRHGQPFIVMELLQGSGKLNVMLQEGWVADEKRGLEIGIDVAQGLRAAQSAGLLHRDVKPGNILFNALGVAKLLDFSVVHAAAGDGEKLVIGTPYYIAPEAARGLEVDFRGDLYSLGATLFHLMAGQPVFNGQTSRDVVRARLKKRAPDIRTIKPGLGSATAAILARMLEIDPNDRHASYDELIADLKAALESLHHGVAESAGGSELAELHDALSGTVRSAATRAEAPTVKRRMSPTLIGIAAMAAIVAAGGIIWAVSGEKGKSGGGKEGSSLATNTADPRLDRQVVPAPPDQPRQEEKTEPASVTPPINPPAVPPTDPPVAPPVNPPAAPPTTRPADPPLAPPTDPPVTPAVNPPAVPPTTRPVDPPVRVKPAGGRVACVLLVNEAVTEAVVKSANVQGHASVAAPYVGAWVHFVRGLDQIPKGRLDPVERGEIDVMIIGTLMCYPNAEIWSNRLGPDDSTLGAIAALGVKNNPKFRIVWQTYFWPRGEEPKGGKKTLDVASAKAVATSAPLKDLEKLVDAINAKHGRQVVLISPVDLATRKLVEMVAGGKFPGITDPADLWAEFNMNSHRHVQALTAYCNLATMYGVSPVGLKPDFSNVGYNGGVSGMQSMEGITDEQNAILQKIAWETVSQYPYADATKGGIGTGGSSLATNSGDPPKQAEIAKPPGVAPPVDPPVDPPAVPPKPAGPAPPKLDAFTGIELSKVADKKLYNAQPNATVLIPRFSAWHVWASETPVPAGWSTADFYATGWSLEEAALGFGFDNVRTQLKDMKGQHSAVYARAPFTVPDPAKIQDLLIQGRFDDAIIVYINGQQVYRSPNLVGEGASTKVSQGATRSPLASYELKDAKKHLKPGANVIAIECHNLSKQDADFILDPALVATPITESRKPIDNNQKLDWTGVDGKLFSDADGLLIDGADKPPKLVNGATKTDFNDRAYNVLVLVKLKTTSAGAVKLDAQSKPKNLNSLVTDSDTQTITVSPRSRSLAFKVKVSGKLQGLTLHLPKGESTIESIHIINERDKKELESWVFDK